MFFSTGDDYRVQAIRDKNQPDRITLDLAVDKLFSRILMSILWIVVGLFIIYANCRFLFSILPIASKMRQTINRTEAKPWRVALIKNVNPKQNMYAWIEIERDGKMALFRIPINQKMTIWQEYLFETDLLLSQNDEEIEPGKPAPYVICLIPNNGSMPVPLDTELSVLSGLKKPELAEWQAQIKQAIHQYQENMLDKLAEKIM